MKKSKINYNGLKVSKIETLMLTLIILLVASSCKKLVDIPSPNTQLVSTNVYTSNATASGVLLGMYSQLMNGQSNFCAQFGFVTGLSADEMIEYRQDATFSKFYTNSLVSTNVLFWNEFYNDIYTCNSVIANLPNKSVTPAVSQQLVGEAKFMRAFYYFYAVNQWGDVPLVTSIDYKANAVASRTPAAKVYEQIIADLKDAQSLLSNDFLGADALTVTTERVRPTKWAATALLARAYLYTGDYPNAAAQSTLVINNSAHFNLVSDLNSVFLKNSNEAIWQLSPVAPNVNTFDAYYYILTGAPGGNAQYAAMSPYLYNSFETGDRRKTNWIGSFTSGSGTTYYYPYKYKVKRGVSVVSEYLMVLRLAEQYLIRAEAEAHGAGGGVSAAVSDLNSIRTRAGLPPTTATIPSDLLTAIMHERKVELFSEWGHRWLDLKRTGTVDAVLGAPGNVCQAKGGIWNSNWALYPLPSKDIILDPHLVQNPGYN